MDDKELTFQLAQLRHAYHLLMDGKVKNQQHFAIGLIAPVIRVLEKIDSRK